jgi:chromosomal replication initiation ATPase DnaA
MLGLGEIRETSVPYSHLLIYLRWQTGVFTNKRIADIFRLNYSSVNHSVRVIKTILQNDPDLKAKIEHLNSLFKV